MINDNILFNIPTTCKYVVSTCQRLLCWVWKSVPNSTRQTVNFLENLLMVRLLLLLRATRSSLAVL